MKPLLKNTKENYNREEKQEEEDDECEQSKERRGRGILDDLGCGNDEEYQIEEEEKEII